jgi:hypothetical protein
MGSKFNRSVELRVFVSGNRALVITDLDMDFDIRANRRRQPNQAEITVYNMSEANRLLLSQEGTAIEFSAGYSGQNKVLFRGVTTSIIHMRSGNTWQSVIYAGDGQKEFLSAYFSASYAAGFSVSQIIKDVANTIGLSVELDLPNDQLTTSITLDGLAKDALKEICEDYGYRYSIQHQVLQVVLKGQRPSRDTQAIQVNASTGLLSPPQITTKGVSLESLLDGAVKPSRLIQVQALQTVQNVKDPHKKKVKQQSADGVYIVDIVNFKGSSKEGAFNMTVEGWKNA